MNRHERRAAKAKGDKGKSTLPPEYYEDIERAAKACFGWIRAHPDAELKWHPPAQDGVLMIAALCDGAKYLADSPDAYAMLADVDAATGRKLTIYQAAWALRRIRALPMPDGSYCGAEVKQESKAYRALRRFVLHDESDRVPPAPCGHCGKVLDGAHPGDSGGTPKAGDLAVCVYCAGVNAFDAGLQVAPVSEEEIEALPADIQGQLRDMQALIRGAMGQTLAGNARARKVDA